MLLVTVDIEDWYHNPIVTGSPFSQFTDVSEFFSRWKGRYDYLTEPTRRVLTILDGLNIRATFFVVADVVEHYPGLVDEISGRGHEIACHGLHHTCKIHPRTKQPMMSQDEFEKRTLRAKRMLEEVSGQQVIGYRAPSAYIGGWMLESLERIGFRYDSSVSVNSFYNKTDSSLKGIDTRPYYPKTGKLEPGGKRGILELPWPYFQVRVKFPTGGGPMLRFFGASYIKKGIEQSLQRGPSLFYFHPIDIAEEKFPGGFSWHRPFFWAIKGRIVEQRIKHLLTSMHVKQGTCKEVLERQIKDDIR